LLLQYKELFADRIMKINKFTQRQVMQNQGYEIFFYSTQEHCNVELHHHDFYEIYYFISGSVEYDIDCCSYLLRPGDIVLIAPGKLHKPVFLEEGKKYQRIVLWLSKKMIEELSTVKTDLTLCFRLAGQEGCNRISNDKNITPQVKKWLDKLLDISNKDSFGADILSKAYIQYILIKLANYLAVNKSTKQHNAQRTPIMEGALAYINSNLTYDLRLDSIADSLEVNKYYLAHEFKRHLGINIGRYITLKRLSLAKELLLSGKSVQDASQESGFNNLSNFFRVFKTEFGLTPRQFYKMMQ